METEIYKISFEKYMRLVCRLPSTNGMTEARACAVSEFDSDSLSHLGSLVGRSIGPSVVTAWALRFVGLTACLHGFCWTWVNMHMMAKAERQTTENTWLDSRILICKFFHLRTTDIRGVDVGLGCRSIW